MEDKGKNSERKRTLKWSIASAGMALSLVAVAVAVAVVVSSLAVTPVMAQQDEVTVTVNAPEYVEEKETFDVTIDVEGITTDFHGGWFDLSFDHNVVQVEDVKDGSIGDTEIPVTMWAPTDSDTIKVMLELSGTTTVSGSGYLAKITFEVKGDDGEESALKLPKRELIKNVFEDDRAISEAIEANWNDATVKVGTGREEKKEEKEEQPSDIIAWDPAEEVVSSTEGESMIFGISVDQTSDIRWQINGTEVETDKDVTEATFTKSAVAGTWNVSAIATGTEIGLSRMHTWIWSVTATSTEAPEETATPTPMPTLTSEVTTSPTPTLSPGETGKAAATPTEGKPKPTPTSAHGVTPGPKSTALPGAEGKPKPPEKTPGFGAIFAIAAMSGIAYMLLKRRRGKEE